MTAVSDIDTEALTSTVRPDHILQIGMGFWASKTLLSAVELGLITELGGGGRTEVRHLAGPTSAAIAYKE